MLVFLAGSQAERVATFARLEPALRESFPGVELGGPIPASVLAQRIAERDITQAELVALPFALALTLWFFRGLVAALLPIAIGAFALAFSTALTRLIAQFVEVSIFSLSISAFLGLGLSIDYSLLVVQRFREELPRHASVVEAVAATMLTAGRAVRVSGITVLVSILVLLLVPVPLVRGLALGGILAAPSALIGALVLLPALLAWIGPAVNRFTVGARGGTRRAEPPLGGRRRALDAAPVAHGRGERRLARGRHLAGAAHAGGAARRAHLPDRAPRCGASRSASATRRSSTRAARPRCRSRSRRRARRWRPTGCVRCRPWLDALARVPGVQQVRTPLRGLDPERGRGERRHRGQDGDRPHRARESRARERASRRMAGVRRRPRRP